MCTSIFVCGFDFSQKQMSSTLQQRFCTKFCVKSGFNGAQTLEMLEKCFDNDTLTRSNVFRWHERFRSGRESIEDDERSGRPSTAKTDENINKIKGWMTVSCLCVDKSFSGLLILLLMSLFRCICHTLI